MSKSRDRSRRHWRRVNKVAVRYSADFGLDLNPWQQRMLARLFRDPLERAIAELNPVAVRFARYTGRGA